MTSHIADRLRYPGPKRMLALDGGGTRGIISIAFLEQIEAVLQRRLGRGDDFVLADYFDVIGGTSVGSILATGLAFGARVSDIRKHFESSARDIFKPTSWGVIRNMFNAGPLTVAVKRVVGDERLDSEKLQTGLAIVSKRMDTGSVWPISNNPAARYWEPRPIPGTNDTRRGNRELKLWELIRASTAAPRYFSAKTVEIYTGVKKGTIAGRFIDGAVSPHNSPALKMFMMAGIKGYNFGGGELTGEGGGKAWDLGAKNLLLVSVGTGLHTSTARTSGSAAVDAMLSLQGMITDGTDLGLLLLQWLGETSRPWILDREVRSLAQDGLNIGGEPIGPLLRFQRYDMRLDRDDLNLDRCADIEEREAVVLRNMLEPANMERLHALASAAAVAQVRPEDFPVHFDALWQPIARSAA